MVDLARCQGVRLRDLHRSMCAAFSDYLVPMSPSFEQFRFMLTQRGYDADLSWIAKVEGQVAAFWLIGGDSKTHPKTAYVISTGTLAQFRGQGLSRLLFDTTHERLAGLGVSALRLEVIQGNVPAQKLYDKLGFHPTRKLACYAVQGEPISPHPTARVNVQPFDLSQIGEQVGTLQDWRPSWQNSFRALQRVARDIKTVGVFDGVRCLGYGVLLRPTSTVAQLAVRTENRRSGLGSAIFASLGEGESGLSILNVDDDATASKAFYESRGAILRTTQVEMVRPIRGRSS